MLKIKNNIELKQLEKFGFKEEKWYCSSYNQNIHIFTRDCFSIDVDTRNFTFLNIDFYGLDLIYDLIEAGLIEKVGE